LCGLLRTGTGDRGGRERFAEKKRRQFVHREARYSLERPKGHRIECIVESQRKEGRCRPPDGNGSFLRPGAIKKKNQARGGKTRLLGKQQDRHLSARKAGDARTGEKTPPGEKVAEGEVIPPRNVLGSSETAAKRRPKKFV